jgi:RNA polymerase sigma-70 factor (ECF subfamily)
MSQVSEHTPKLIQQARNGNRDAVAELCVRNRPYLRVAAKSLLSPAIRRRTDASDIVQLTEMEIVRSIRDFRGSTTQQWWGWLNRILRRNVADAVRDNRAARRDVRREQSLTVKFESGSCVCYQPPSMEPSPSQFADDSDALAQLNRAIDLLLPDQRVVVRMRYFDGLKLHEIASALEKTTGAVAGLLQRGLKALKDELGSVSHLG